MTLTDVETIETARLAGETCSRCGAEIRYDRTRSPLAPAVDLLFSVVLAMPGLVAHRQCLKVTADVPIPTDRSPVRQERVQAAQAWTKGRVERKGGTLATCPKCGGAATRRGRPEQPSSSRQWRCRSVACGADGTWRQIDGEIVAKVRRPKES